MTRHPVQASSPRVSAERLVGRPVRRTEDLRFVTGRGCYAITLEEAPSTLNPLGAKGAGEGGIVATGAAAANAVAAALAPLGVVIRELPLSAANLAHALRAARRAR